MNFSRLKFVAIGLVALTLIASRTFGKVILLRSMSESLTMNLTCVSEDDGAALTWNYNAHTRATKNKVLVTDFQPVKAKSKGIGDCAIWNSTECFAKWENNNGGWKTVKSARYPMTPVLDYRWEGFEEYVFHESLESEEYRHVRKLNDSSGAVVFSVRGLRNIYVALCGTKDPKNDHCVWIVIARKLGNGNGIWFCENGIPDHETIENNLNCKILDFQKDKKEKLIDPYKWRTFTLKWKSDSSTVSLTKEMETEPFLTGKLEEWLPAYHLLIKSELLSRVKFHFYEYFRTDRENAVISTTEFRHNGKNLCLDVAVGYCSKCEIKFEVAGNEDVKTDVVTSEHVDKENSLDNEILSWRFVRVNATLTSFDSNLVQLKIRTIFNGNEGKGHWALDNFRVCQAVGGLRESTLTLERDLTEAWPPVNCQKLSYNENAVVPWDSTNYWNNTGRKWTTSIKGGRIKIPNSCDPKLYEFLSNRKGSCGSTCGSVGRGWSICSREGCTCDRGFAGENCNLECSRDTYGYNCHNICGSCGLNTKCDRVTGYCEQCERPEASLLPFCTEKLKAPIVGGINDTWVRLIQTVKINVDLKIEVYFKIEELIDTAFNAILSKTSEEELSYEAIARDLNPKTKYTAFANVLVTTDPEATPPVVKSEKVIFETTCMGKHAFELIPGEDYISVEKRPDSKMCPIVGNSQVYCKETGMVTHSKSACPSFCKISGLKPYTEYEITIDSYSGKKKVMFQKKVWTLESVPGKVNYLHNTSISDTKATIQWKPPTEPNGIIINYKVSLKLTTLRGCEYLQRSTPDEIEKVLNVTETTAYFENLHPYAKYNVTVVAYNSKPGIPEMTNIETEPSDTVTSVVSNLRFETNEQNHLMWKSPENCTTITGPANHTKLIFEGVSNWVRNISKWDQTETHAFNMGIFKKTLLLPYTQYRVRAYVIRDYDKPENPQLYREVLWTTPPAAPPAPTDVDVYEIDSDNNRISLRWIPPYPPKGEIESYHISIEDNSQRRQSCTFKVSEDGLKCKTWKNYVYVDDLILDQNILQDTKVELQIRAKNKNVTGNGRPAVKPIVLNQLYDKAPGAPINLTSIVHSNGVVTLKWQHPTLSFTKITNFRCKVQLLNTKLRLPPEIHSPITVLYPVMEKLEDYTMQLYLLSSSTYSVAMDALNGHNTSSEAIEINITTPQSVAFASEEKLNVIATEDRMKIKYPLLVNETQNITVSFHVQGVSLCVSHLTPSMKEPETVNDWIADTYKPGDSRPEYLTIKTTWNVGVKQNCSLHPGEPYVVAIIVEDEDSKVLTSLKSSSMNLFDKEDSLRSNLGWLVVLPILALSALVLFIWYRKRGKASPEETYEEILPLSKTTRSTSNSTAPSTIQRSTTSICAIQKPVATILPRDPQSCCMRIEEFEEYTKEALASGLLDSQYSLFSRGVTQPCEYGALPENVAKNRYKNVMAYDHSRVILEQSPGDPFSDYINASYIQGYRSAKAFIAAQGPKPNTVKDFWKMVWQEDVRVICMLTNVVEGGKTKCEKYWPEVGTRLKYGDILVSNTGHEVFADYTFRTFRLGRRKEKREVTHLHYTGWPDHGIPMYSQSLAAYLKKLLATPSGNGPVVVHCSAGVGRTGTIILCAICLRRAVKEEVIDVSTTVASMRRDRANMVDNAQQYLLAHLIIVECMVPVQTQISCADVVPEKIKELRNQLPSDIKRDRKNHCVKKEWPARATLNPGSRNVTRPPLIQPSKYLLPPLHIKLDLMKQYVKALNKDDRLNDSVWLDRALHFSAIPNSPILEETTKRRDSVIDSARSSEADVPVCVDGVKAKRQYLASRLPLPSTISNFWRLISEENVELVIVLQTPDLNDLANYSDIMPGDSIINPVPNIQVETKASFEDEENFQTNKLLLTDTSKGEERLQPVTVLTCKGWESGRAPSATVLVSLWMASEKISRKEAPTLVLCQDGVTACGLYLTLSFLLERMAVERECDVISAVRAVRRSKPEFVSSREEFEYLYDVALTYVKCFQTYANFT